jgi:hypothetical protein
MNGKAILIISASICVMAAVTGAMKGNVVAASFFAAAATFLILAYFTKN